MGDPSTLRLCNVTLRFGGLTVLDDVSLSVRPGELLALIGPNGAGKTSILNTISGLYRPTVGQVLLGDRELRGLPPHVIASMGIARTFQHGELFPHMTVLENLLVGRHANTHGNTLAECLFLPNVRREEAKHRHAVEEIIEFVELERYRHKPVDSLPFGIQKVVGFARALTSEPRLLLLDEPCAGLNREDREDLARHIMRIQHEKGLAIVWVEHDMQMVADLADRLYVLNHGRFLADGEPATVLNDAKVIEAYIGHSAPARASVAVDREHQIQTGLLHAVAVAVAGRRDRQAVGGILRQLADYNRVHFASEELLMRVYEYPELDAHAFEHRRIVDDVRELTVLFESGDDAGVAKKVSQVEHFLLEHIASRDRKFSQYLGTLGVSLLDEGRATHDRRAAGE